MSRKLIFMSFVLFIILISVKAQINIYNLSLTDSTIAVAYKKIDNSIKVVGLKKNTFQVISSSSKITYTYNDKFNYNVTYNKSGLDTLFILVNNKKIFSKVFKVDTLTDIKVHLGNISTNEATKIDIIKQNQLRISYNNYFKSNASVQSFLLSIYNSKGEIIYYINESGALIRPNILKEFLKLQQGFALLFSNIVGVSSGGISYRLEDLRIKVI